MIPFAKPGASDPYDVMGAAAAVAALADAGVAYADVQQAYVGYVYGDSTCRPEGALSRRHDRHPGLQRQQQLLDRIDRALSRATGGRKRSGRLRAGAGLRADDAGRARHAFQRPSDAVRRIRSRDRRARRRAGCAAGHPLFRRRRASRTCSKYGTTLETFARIRAKASRHATNNPLALFRREVSVDEVLASPMLMPGVMTRLMACPPTCGAAAAVIVSEAFARRHHLDTTVSIAAQAMTTDTPRHVRPRTT